MSLKHRTRSPPTTQNIPELGISLENSVKDIGWRKKQLRERFLKFEGEKYAEDNNEY